MQVGSAAYKVVPSWETHGTDNEGMRDAVDWALEQRRAGRQFLVYCTHVSTCRVAAFPATGCTGSASVVCA